MAERDEELAELLREVRALRQRIDEIAVSERFQPRLPPDYNVLVRSLPPDYTVAVKVEPALPPEYAVAARPALPPDYAVAVRVRFPGEEVVISPESPQ